MSLAYLLTCALVLGQPADRAEWLLVPQFAPGLELVYKGTCIEESLVPGVQHQRQYALETILFVHDFTAGHWDAALQTSVTLLAAKKNAEAKNTPSPGSVRLELVEIDRRGRLRGGKNTSLAIPLTGLPLVETGAFFELPSVRVNMQSYWEATEEGRPLRGWQVAGVDQRSGTACVKLLGTQQSADWNQPRADKTAWRRRDLVWFAPQLGLVCRVERAIEHRDPARQDPTHRLVVAYELESKLKYFNRFLEDRKEEIAKARKFNEEAAPMLENPALHRAQIDNLQRRIHYCLENQAPTPYRKTIVHLQGRLEHARRGEVPVGLTGEEASSIRAALTIGQKVPDFVITDLTRQKSRRFYQFLGLPVLLVYYNPTSDNGKEALRFGQHVYDRHGSEVTVLGMAVSEDADLVRKQHEDLGLAFGILDGRAMHRTFGVDGTPRLILLDADAVVRATFTGWGAHIPGEVLEEIRKCLPK